MFNGNREIIEPIPDSVGSVQGYDYYWEIPIEREVIEIITPTESEKTDQTNQPYEPNEERVDYES
jgi:hypothetical protein